MALAQGRSYGVFAGNVPIQPGDFLLESVAIVTAATGGTQATGTPINAQTNIVISVSGHSVTLPPSSPGLCISLLLITSGATCLVFPAPGEFINALAVNTDISMAALTGTTFCCAVAGQWYTIPRTPS